MEKCYLCSLKLSELERVVMRLSGENRMRFSYKQN